MATSGLILLEGGALVDCGLGGRDSACMFWDAVLSKFGQGGLLTGPSRAATAALGQALALTGTACHMNYTVGRKIPFSHISFLMRSRLSRYSAYPTPKINTHFHTAVARSVSIVIIFASGNAAQPIPQFPTRYGACFTRLVTVTQHEPGAAAPSLACPVAMWEDGVR